MNLELLDPFRRQNPDRIDSTLNLPKSLHFRKKPDGTAATDSKEALGGDDEDWKAANHIIFNRRGSYIAVAYASGTVAIFDTVSRTLSSLHRPEASNDENSDSNNNNNNEKGADDEPSPPDHGITSLSWSRRSRTLLAGSLGHKEVMLIDNTHPHGAEECCSAIQLDENKEGDEDQRSHSPTPFAPQKSKSSSNETSFVKRNVRDHFNKPVSLDTKIVPTKMDIRVDASGKLVRRTLVPVDRASARRYPSVRFKFPVAVGSSLQVHPRDELSGHAVLSDGSLAAFSVPQAGFEEQGGQQSPVLISTIFPGEQYHITCSAFDPHGEKIYAATSDGKLLGFEVEATFNALASGSEETPSTKPNFVIQIPGGATAWHIVVSRSGRYVIVNSSDAAVRLYETSECWTTPEEVEKPVFVFQDVVSKVRFASCDLSGDG
jgi:hypothetical protein